MPYIEGAEAGAALFTRAAEVALAHNRYKVQLTSALIRQALIMLVEEQA